MSKCPFRIVKVHIKSVREKNEESCLEISYFPYFDYKYGGQAKTGIRQDETEERYLSVTYTPNGEC